MKRRRNTGTDGIPAWVLRDSAAYLAGLIWAVFNNLPRKSTFLSSKRNQNSWCGASPEENPTNRSCILPATHISNPMQ